MTTQPIDTCYSALETPAIYFVQDLQKKQKRIPSVGEIVAHLAKSLGKLPPCASANPRPTADQLRPIGVMALTTVAPADSTSKAPAPQKKKYRLAKFPTDLGKVDRKVCHDYSTNSGIFSYLVLPGDEPHHEGLFPIGELNPIAGASGSWKTTLLLFFIWLWTKGERFFGRLTCPGNGKYIIISFDRSENGFARTAVRMGFDPNEFNVVQLDEDAHSDRNPIGSSMTSSARTSSRICAWPLSKASISKRVTCRRMARPLPSEMHIW